MTNPPVLKLPYFTLPFIIKCDACGMEVGSVLMQQGQPIGHMSKALRGKALKLSTYEKELFALVTVVQHWRPYLFGQQFILKTY